MTTAMLEATGQVASTHLADGVLIRLSGALTEHHVTDLRLALLMPLPSNWHDVLIDAGEVTDVCEPALAVLLAAAPWAAGHGARFALSRSSVALDRALVDCGLPNALPRLGPVG